MVATIPHSESWDVTSSAHSKYCASDRITYTSMFGVVVLLQLYIALLSSPNKVYSHILSYQCFVCPQNVSFEKCEASQSIMLSSLLILHPIWDMVSSVIITLMGCMHPVHRQGGLTRLQKAVQIYQVNRNLRMCTISKRRVGKLGLKLSSDRKRTISDQLVDHNMRSLRSRGTCCAPPRCPHWRSRTGGPQSRAQAVVGATKPLSGPTDHLGT
jgi:hypothetical protein